MLPTSTIQKSALVAIFLVMPPLAGCKKKVASIAPPPTATVDATSPVRTVAALPTVEISAEPSVVEEGEDLTLSWSSTGADSLVIDHGVGTVPTSGSLQITPEQSATYTATATNSAGSATASTRVTVAAAAPAPLPADADSISIEDLIRQGLIKDVFFDFDQYVLTAEAQEVLRQNGSHIRQYPDVTFILEGHCDERGTSEYNLALGDRRAQAVKNYLVSLGVQNARLETISYGEERPFAEGHGEASLALNRRVHFTVRR